MARTPSSANSLPHQLMRSVRPVLHLTLALLAGVVGCDSPTAPIPAAERIDLAAILPAGPAYIRGQVVSRDAEWPGGPSALIAVNPRDLTAAPSAYVMLTSDPTVVWRDGRVASVAEVRPGRVVSAWIVGGVLLSQPAVAAGHVLVIER